MSVERNLFSEQKRKIKRERDFVMIVYHYGFFHGQCGQRGDNSLFCYFLPCTLNCFCVVDKLPGGFRKEFELKAS